MKKSKFTEAHILFALSLSETGATVAEVCRKMGISDATFYNWKKNIYEGCIYLSLSLSQSLKTSSILF